MTEAHKLDSKLRQILGQEWCTVCDALLSILGARWNNRDSGSGTPCCTLDVDCEACGASILHRNSWWPWVDDEEDFLEALKFEIGK